MERIVALHSSTRWCRLTSIVPFPFSVVRLIEVILAHAQVALVSALRKIEDFPFESLKQLAVSLGV